MRLHDTLAKPFSVCRKVPMLYTETHLASWKGKTCVWEKQLNIETDALMPELSLSLR